MATPEERMQILKMIEAKQVTAEEGAKLLAALSNKEGPREPNAPQPPPGTSGKWFRVRVTDLKSGKRKVNVNIPLGLVDVGLKMGAKFAPAGLEGLDVEKIIAAIKTGGEGKIADVSDEEQGEHVEVFIE
jgi:hypothetical protein